MMREYNDFDDADIVKEKMLRNLQKQDKYSFIMAIDDELKNVEMFTRNQIIAKQWKINNNLDPKVKEKEENWHDDLVTPSNSF